ncbi:hypothetical protein IMSAGC019_00610 [Lachnospiraceae bacterium]|nr:hypothetical protein IMSAGC019_00610 [Lachnospiraceae bacterium]
MLRLIDLEQLNAVQQREAIQALLNELERQEKALRKIKTIADAYFGGKVTLTTGNEDFDPVGKVYDVRTYMGMVHSNAYEGLNLPIPRIF